MDYKLSKDYHGHTLPFARKDEVKPIKERLDLFAYFEIDCINTLVRSCQRFYLVFFYCMCTGNTGKVTIGRVLISRESKKELRLQLRTYFTPHSAMSGDVYCDKSPSILEI